MRQWLGWKPCLAQNQKCSRLAHHGLIEIPLIRYPVSLASQVRLIIMPIYELKTEQFLPISLDEAWAFFATPVNLDRITPPELKFKIVSDVPGKMYPGQMIEYRIQAIPGIWQSWLTEITHVRDREYFVDEQRIGPYKMWHHQHSFEAVPDGTLVRDHVHYTMIMGPIGTLVHELYVKKQVRYIFNERQKILNSLFPTEKPSEKARNAEPEAVMV